MAKSTDPEPKRDVDEKAESLSAAPEEAETEAVGEAPGAPAGAAEPEPDYRDRWLRAEAELQNFRRRVQRDLEEARRSSEERAFLEIIAALDDLDRALRSGDPSGAEGWKRGVELTARRLREYLAQQGVAEVDPLGRPFDPVFHEAVMEVDPPAGAAPGSVVEVVLKGYARGGRALRAARVVVARHEAADDPGGGAG